MSRVCSICEKRAMSGNKVSHSNRKSTRAWNVNVQKVKMIKDGKPVTEYVCTRCLRTMHKVEKA
ncbi:MAG: 50S ribosomal protein L28 [Clostridia bacterium]|jgi:large subunit ribosomal protein L28|nr:50S ribosomal protein L28 [Clostridia bacterium]